MCELFAMFTEDEADEVFGIGYPKFSVGCRSLTRCQEDFEDTAVVVFKSSDSCVLGGDATLSRI